MATLSMYSGLDAEYDKESVFTVEVRDALYDQHALIVKSNDMEVIIYTNAEQLKLVSEAITEYISTNLEVMSA